MGRDRYQPVGVDADGTCASRTCGNDGPSALAEAVATIEQVAHGALAWGDLDKDGDLDLALSGYTGAALTTKVYRNNAGAFVDSGIALTGVYYACLAWGDYDNDGDQDLMLSGASTVPAPQTLVSTLYANTGGNLVWVFSGLSRPRMPEGHTLKGYSEARGQTPLSPLSLCGN